MASAMRLNSGQPASVWRERVKPGLALTGGVEAEATFADIQTTAATEQLLPLNPANRRIRDPYVRWCGRGGVARLPPIPFVLTRRVSRGRRLFLLRADPLDGFDGHRRVAGFLRDFAVLLHDMAARGLITVEPAQELGRHAPVGALGAVFIDDIEKGKLACGIGSRFVSHGRLVVDQGAIVK